MSSLPFPYTTPTPNQSQVNQRARIFLGPDQFSGIGAAAALGGTPPNPTYLSAIGAVTANFTCSLSSVIRAYDSALVAYNAAGIPAADVSINSLTMLYAVSGAALTSGSFQLNDTTLTPGIAAALGPAIIPAKSLLTPVSANVVGVTGYASNPAALVSFPSLLTIALQVVAPASSVFVLYGALLDFNISR